ncbi:hypothetical protein FDP41_000568 [Naegleria fowleri]|uniref:Uncharacterized protein n=1 Tax=Naegleria fowleri TaxID=5763 RepID=A0A6A5CHA2_NAEFO|nr:uncharacterized protein FDP41_000568 [Naegleria fowleri]KAF0984669.1 hypothetical protein FDP41_000568 [Naegleria fowleri]
MVKEKSPPSETLLNANLPNVNFVASPSSSFDNQSLQTKQSPTVATTTVSTPFSYIPDNTNKTFKVDHRNQQGTTSNITTTQPRSFPITQQNQLLPSINELLNQSATFMTSASCHHFNYNGNRAILPCVHDLVSHGFQFSQSSSIFTL